MKYPEPKFRCPTGEAIASLARRLNLPNEPGMQDWEYEVADSNRIDEFLSVYESGDLSEDEKFTLMETIIESYEDLDIPNDKTCKKILLLLEENIKIHIYTIWYWSLPDNDDVNEQWRITPFARSMLENYYGQIA